MEKADLQNLYQTINKILFEDWDPIGINISALNDEYLGYVPEIVRLKLGGADVETIAFKLNEIVINDMGFEGNLDQSRKVAQKILDL